MSKAGVKCILNEINTKTRVVQAIYWELVRLNEIMDISCTLITLFPYLIDWLETI